MNPERGQYIIFYLENWRNNKLLYKKEKAKILSICKDPLGFHENKCVVKINGDGYGIPFSEILEILPADNEQLSLF